MNLTSRKQYIQKYFISVISFLKYSLHLKKKEILLSVVIFFYLIISDFISRVNFPKNISIIFLIQIALLIVENYLTICVYSTIKKIIKKEKFKVKDILTDGGYFFGRILFYKIFVAFSAGILISIAFGIIDILKSTPLFITTLIFTLTLLWLSVPFYFILLTFFSPLIIICKDANFSHSVKMSYYFIRENLKEISGITLIIGVFWFFCIFFLKVYNNFIGIKILFFYFVSLLEILTIKTFMFFYFEREGKNGRNV